MSFKETILFMLNMVNKSLQIELNNFFEKVLKKDDVISKQAFSENRQKISPNAFIELNDKIVEVIYEECNEYELWNGYRLSAIDGTTIELPNTELLRNEFGYAKNQHAGVAIARGSACCIFDVLNKIVIKSKIDRFGTSERKMAMDLISEMKNDNSTKELILFDRGYPSSEIISKLVESNIYFVMRLKNSVFKKKIDAEKQDQIIEIKYDKKVYNVRVIKFYLESEIEEVLITNLFDESMKIEDFKELYFKRWGIEIKYDELKNRLEIENFTGATKIAIEQDFYAPIYLSNMIELARKDIDETVTIGRKNKNTKYEYKINLNILIGSLKDKLIMMFLEESPRKRNKIYKEVMKQVSRSSIPIRPDRQNPRIKRIARGKYKKNKKRSL
ncbi:IS4 family transposase [Clostridium tyrobutyricum]|uniref:IS4 family transposase n=1 Tax=Clostridium tyrobutyricum TaxID=1519 RepID=UPI0002D482C2|nr:IS4 family transposase [Clostridium tyrobutyricum]MEA5009814.1 IS4 family transposase [Clostridium tyrobutyricum]